MRCERRTVLILLAAMASPGATAASRLASVAPMGKGELTDVLKAIDEGQRSSGDYKSLVYLQQKERNKADLVYEVIVYRRDQDDKMMILFAKPKSEEGKGYLRIDKNLWMYDPTVGKWDRRTERERIGGTDSRRADFDESRLAEDFEPVDEGLEKLGAYAVRKIRLVAKEGADVAFPVVQMWVDTETATPLKRQEFALSGRLMRTAYMPKWQKLFSESKKAEVWYPTEIRIYDEVEKENSTLMVMKAVDLRSLDPNIFTKAWLESKSR